MEIRHLRRGCALASIFALNLVQPVTANAATLAAFSFDAGGQFTAAPSALDVAVADAHWQDDLATLTNLTGNPGRAFVASSFNRGNLLHLTLIAAAGLNLVLEHLRFDVRASTNGPTTWAMMFGNQELGHGPTTTNFRSFDLALDIVPGHQFVIDIRGLGASANSGTLRLDNLRVDGHSQPVPLPGSLFLIVTPLLGSLLRAWRQRYWPSVPRARVNGHSRQASNNGKNKPSMIGRASRLAIIRP